MIGTIVRILIAGSLVAGVASCKKKEGDAAGTSNQAPTKSAEPQGTGIPECDTYIAAMTKFVTCDKLGPAKDAYAGNLEKDKESFSHAKDKAATAEQCKKAMEDLVAGAKDRGCPLQ